MPPVKMSTKRRLIEMGAPEEIANRLAMDRNMQQIREMSNHEWNLIIREPIGKEPRTGRDTFMDIDAFSELKHDILNRPRKRPRGERLGLPPGFSTQMAEVDCRQHFDNLRDLICIGLRPAPQGATLPVDPEWSAAWSGDPEEEHWGPPKPPRRQRRSKILTEPRLSEAEAREAYMKALGDLDE